MVSLVDLFRRGAKDASSAELWKLITASRADRDALRAREVDRASERMEALLAGDDDEVDRIEAELATIARAMDRHEIRIPELERLHAERRAAEAGKANEAAFLAAVDQHVATARKIDDALADIDKLFAAFATSGAELARLKPYHGAGRAGIDAATIEGKIDGTDLRMAILFQAPAMARALRIEAFGGHGPFCFSEREAASWEKVKALPRQGVAAGGTAEPIETGTIAAADRARKMLAEVRDARARFE